MRFWTFILTVFVSALSLTSCHATQKNNENILLIAIEQFGSQDFVCPMEGKKGFKTLCDDFIRWTHAYTPSIEPTSALAAVLMGNYPSNLGFTKMGSKKGQFLSPSFDTLAEDAYSKGFHTMFFSGGASVLRKSGLNQGFEIFEDNIRFDPQQMNRPLASVLNVFSGILEETKNKSQFTVFYVPDLLFIERATKNSLGEQRNLSFESQMEELDESLESLFNILKTQDRWKQTHIFVFGLNGHQRISRPGVSAHSNLYSDRTQVALFYKPTGAARSLSVDQNVSLIDLEPTIQEILHGRKSTSDSTHKVSLDQYLSHNRETPPNDRVISSEAPYSSSPVLGLRSGEIFCRKDNGYTCYNSLNDRDELFRIPKSDASAQKLIRLWEATDHPDLPTIESKDYPPLPISDHPCSKLFTKETSRPCDISALNLLSLWLSEENNPNISLSQKESTKRKFIREYWWYKTDQALLQTSRKHNFPWDLNPEVLIKIQILDQVLELPAMQKLKNPILKSYDQMLMTTTAE